MNNLFKFATLFLVLISPTIHANFFPASGKQIYKMIHWPVNENDDVIEGEFYLEALSTKSEDGIIHTEYRSSSTTFPKFQYFSVDESKGISINGLTYIGPGSDELEGESYKLVSLPLQSGAKEDFPLMLTKVKGEEEITLVNNHKVLATKLELIGTWNHYYTMVGNYWITPGLGIVKASYTTVDGRNVELLLENQ